MEKGKILWRPNYLWHSSNMHKFRQWINNTYQEDFREYEELRKWSVENISDFWESILRYFKINSSGEYSEVLNTESMPGNQWFQGLKLNYAENNLMLADQDLLALSFNETGEASRILRPEFLKKSGAIRKFLEDSGVREGDRVASFLPNVPEALESLYAVTSIGAIWSSSSPDFGSEAIIDRFSQITPKVLLGVDGYTYNGKRYGRSGVLTEVAEKISSIKTVLVLESTESPQGKEKFYNLSDVVKGGGKLEFNRVPFQHPLWILYSSGTTGPPKAIVQSHGGILLEHQKLLRLHYNLKKSDKFFWFTTTGWMMWNLVASTMGSGATAVLYDGSATYPDNYFMWKVVDDLGISFFGTSAAYISHLMQEKVSLRDKFPLERLYAIGSTGSPLSPEAFRYVYEHIKKDLWLASISGGTDVCTAFLGGCPCLPVREGELQCIDLGADIYSFNEDGVPVTGQVGELVLKKPMPSMPIYLWNDDGEKLRETYFSKYPGVWRHGDWVIITKYGSAIILGRSDSTLKRRGIRIGTAEIYGVLEGIEGVKDSIIVGIELKGGGYYMPLFVVPKDTEKFEELEKEIKEKIREDLSPRHVPDAIIRVSQIPKTINGKKMEVPLKKLLMGFQVDEAMNVGSMANPDSLQEYEAIAKKIRRKFN